MHHVDYVKIATGLFILLNPFVLIPVYLGLTGDMDRGQRTKIAFSCAVAVFVIMVVAVFAGQHLLKFFGITVPDFRIAGGLLIGLMALTMARGEHEGMRYSPKEHEEAQNKDSNVAVVPLAIPLMAGPASICGAIIYAGWCGTVVEKGILITMIFAQSVLLWLAMMLAVQIGRALGHTGQQILKRIMGLILLALAIDFLVVGIKHAFGISG